MTEALDKNTAVVVSAAAAARRDSGLLAASDIDR